MTDPTITDLRRELEKARHALIDAQSHLASHAEMNAALHCATTVMYSPLHAKVTAAIGQIEHALKRTDQTTALTPDSQNSQNSQNSEGPWAALLADLDRCEHGRHQGDACGSCGPWSHGNPHLKPGSVIGYGLRGDAIVMPAREFKHNPTAWRLRLDEEAQR